MAEYRKITKPVVPQCIADWYEENKDNFENNLAYLIKDYLDDRIEDDKLVSWFDKANKINNFDDDYNIKAYAPIQTLVNMHQFGYDIKKEKLYTVELPDPKNSKGVKTYLAKNEFGEVELFTSLIGFADDWKQEKNAQLTEDEIKKDFEWTFKFKKEVKEDE